MSLAQNGLFELPPFVPRQSLNFSSNISEFPLEKKRRAFAEERTGEIVIKVAGLGYIALSEVYYRPIDVPGDAPIKTETDSDPGFYQFELL